MSTDPTELHGLLAHSEPKRTTRTTMRMTPFGQLRYDIFGDAPVRDDGRTPEAQTALTNAARIAAEGRIADAITLLTKVGEAAPGNVDIARMLGALHESADDTRNAQYWYRQAVALDGDLRSVVALGSLYGRAGRTADALALHSYAWEHRDGSASDDDKVVCESYLASLARTFDAVGLRDAADLAILRHGTDPVFMYYMAFGHILESHADDARRIISTVLPELAPDDRLAQPFLDLRARVNGLSTVTAGGGSGAGPTPPPREVNLDVFDLNALVAHYLPPRGDYGVATIESDFGELRFDLHGPKEVYGTWSDHFDALYATTQSADRAFGYGLYDDAIDILTDLMISAPDFMPALRLLADAYMAKGNYAEAEYWIKQYIAYTQRLDGVYTLSIVYRQLGRGADSLWLLDYLWHNRIEIDWEIGVQVARDLLWMLSAEPENGRVMISVGERAATEYGRDPWIDFYRGLGYLFAQRIVEGVDTLRTLLTYVGANDELRRRAEMLIAEHS
ncbi:tetratricopeptide repeat protein [Gordonia sp. TBRC 11910]|uniref:Tetratricopeptide repeat protein n=1 Tax=Gordonia asplenii TaxID=2725283 RepID=A0A848L1H9_9ACTN|nr:tetratricopeptide repeat protein [Gordonia asplenii]NMO04559.1 tetratricopeptide repeat protein [Gordonia asplenii]